MLPRMNKPDQLRELFRMQKALNERIGVKTDGMSDEDKTKWRGASAAGARKRVGLA